MRKKTFGTKRKLQPDTVYKSELVSRLTHMLIWEGKKSTAEAIVYGSFELISKKSGGKDPLEVFKKAVDNARPLLEVKSRRVGGATYQVPIEVKEDRGLTLAIRWIRDFARNKKGGTMKNKLADEILSAYNNDGPAIKKREDTHRMAEANRAFSHYRW